MLKIIIAGFKPFFEYTENPTEELIKYLNSLDKNNYSLDTIILDVNYQKIFNEFDSFIKNKNPDLILLTGLSYNRDYFSLETKAVNLMGDKRPDNTGTIIEIKKEIETNQVSFLHTNLEKHIFDNIYNQLKKDFELKISSDAGTYLCNFIYYKVLSKYKFPCLFIHVPANENIKKNSIFTQKDINSFVEKYLEYYSLICS